MADITKEELTLALSFFKVSSDNKVLMNEEYELRSIDNKSIGLFFEKRPNGRFKIHTIGNERYDNSSNLLPDCILEKIKSVETKEDIDRVFGSDDFYFTHYYPDLYYVGFDYPLLAKQTVAEPGYGLNDIILHGSIDVHFNLSNDVVTSVEMRTVSGTLGPDDVYGDYIYDGIERTFNTESDYANFNFINFTDQQMTCMSTRAGIIITDEQCDADELNYEGDPYGSSAYYYVPYFVEDKISVSLTIDNKVNGAIKFNAYKEKTLEYTIIVNNTGNANSTGNAIVTYVPSGVIVDRDSISDSGVYDAEAGTITWQVETLVAGVSVEFSYKATAPSNTNGKELIGYSSVTSDQLTTAVLSADTIVTLDRIIEVINNPNTGTMVYIANTNIGMPLNCLIVVTVLICIMFAICIKKYKFLKK